MHNLTKLTYTAKVFWCKKKDSDVKKTAYCCRERTSLMFFYHKKRVITPQLTPYLRIKVINW